MAIRTYHDFVLAAGDVSQDIHGLHRFKIRVVRSPLEDGTICRADETVCPRSERGCS